MYTKSRCLSIYRENCSRMESRQLEEVLPSSSPNLSSRGQSQGSPGVEDRRNGTYRAMERSGPWNGK